MLDAIQIVAAEHRQKRGLLALALEALLRLMRGRRYAPYLQLPAQAWEDPRLLSECPHCRQPLRFNPFIVDNRKV